MAAILFWVCIASIDTSTSTPVPVKTVGWKSEPNVRGTWRLLVSCVVTLSLCVYTALHLNVPPKDARKRDIYLTKAFWVVMGIFAPEVVVYTAWRQFRSAAMLTQEINDILATKGQLPGTEGSPRKYDWTIVHSFYAGMGGFAIDPDDLPGEKFIPDHRPMSGVESIPSSPRLSLTARTTLELGRLGYLPDVSRRQIADKGKQNFVAKSLVCLQAGWIVLQCVTRLASHLPITFLEINTLAHVLCALAMYGLWWHKPLDVQVPTQLTGEEIRPWCALIWMNCRLSEVLLRGVPELRGLSYEPPVERWPPVQHEATSSDSERFRVSGSRLELPRCPEGSIFIVDGPSPPPSTRVVSLHPGEKLSNTGLGPSPDYFGYYSTSTYLQRALFLDPGLSKEHEYCKLKEPIYLDRIAVTRWELTSIALQNAAITELNFHNLYVFWSADSAISNWPELDLLGYQGLYEAIEDWRKITALGFASGLYGGIHAAAWREYFPTLAEEMLWKVSSLIILASGFVLGFGVNLLTLKLGRRYSASALWVKLHEMVSLVLLVFLVAYAFSRIFLVVEVFISLRRLPESAYETPLWTQWIPHL